MNKFIEQGLSSATTGAVGLGVGAINNMMQLNQQEKLMDLNIRGQKELGRYNNILAMDLWNKTNFGAQMQHLKEAGLNPALMYKQGGSGGTTAGSGVSNTVGGQADSKTMDLGEMIALQKANSEIELNKASANKLNAEAETTNESRDTLIENMRQSGIETWFRNIQSEMMRDGWNENDEKHIFKNLIYNKQTGGYDGNSPEVKKFMADLFKTEAEKMNLDAQAFLANEKAQIVFEELLIATENADSNKIHANAMKLAKEWETGEFTNWRTWVEIANQAVGSVGNLFKNIKTLPNKK